MRSLFGVIIFALDVWAVMSIINSAASRNEKIIWVLIVAILPVIGFVVWWFAGPKAAQP